MTSVEVRVLGPACIEDHHAHLLRVGARHRALFLTTGNDDRGVEGHCLQLLSTQAILIGGYVNGTLRASVEILPDRTARSADAVFTAEAGFDVSAMKEMLIARLLDEARSYQLSEIRLRGIENAAMLASSAFTTGVDIVEGPPLRLRFGTQMPKPFVSAPAALAYA